MLLKISRFSLAAYSGGLREKMRRGGLSIVDIFNSKVPKQNKKRMTTVVIAMRCCDIKSISIYEFAQPVLIQDAVNSTPFFLHDSRAGQIG